MKKVIENRAQLATSEKNILFSQNWAGHLPPKRTYVVSGIERGGTSMVAGICRALGVDFSDRAGLNHEDPAFLRDDIDLLAKRIKARNSEKDVWGFKSPKASLQLNFFEKNLRNPHYIFVYRNSLSIADSWIQRGAGNINQVLERTVIYHQAQLELINTSKNPVLFINYERAVASDKSKKDLVLALANFVGAETGKSYLEAALSMITGDGQGYVNLPKEYFLVSPVKEIPRREEILLDVEYNAKPMADGFLKYENTAPGQICRLANGHKIPKGFFLELDLNSGDLRNFSENPIRIFFNFIGKRHPGHCARPIISAGMNRYYIETSGNALDISFGVIKPPKKLKIDVKAFHAKKEDAKYAIAAHPNQFGRPEPVVRSYKRIWRKLWR